MKQFLTFRRLQSLDEAPLITAVLEQHSIPFEVVTEEDLGLPQHFIGQRFDAAALIKIPADYFAKANNLLQQAVTADIDIIEPDYHLLSFTEEELRDILRNPDEWGDYDYALAVQLLRKRGIEYSDKELAQLKQERLAELAVPEPGKPVWIVLGYMLAILGGLLGVAIGYQFMRGKKTLPDGRRIYVFTKETRDHGITIFAIGLITIALALLLRLWFGIRG